jgi:hypothetical protein
VALLARLGRLAPDAPIIVRESGVRRGVEVRAGTYPVVYRSVQEYEAVAADAALRVVAVELNRGYAHMEIGVELVNLARRFPPLARRDAAVVGGPLWRVLQATAPISLDLFPERSTLWVSTAPSYEPLRAPRGGADLRSTKRIGNAGDLGAPSGSWAATLDRLQAWQSRSRSRPARTETSPTPEDHGPPEKKQRRKVRRNNKGK